MVQRRAGGAHRAREHGGRVLLAYGTRPEAIKMAPVVRALHEHPALEPVVCSTAQHREMVDQVHRLFGIVPDIDLDLMRPDQQLNDLTARALSALDRTIVDVAPDWLLVQGDTTTAMAAALAGFHRGIATGHIEAGLRTGDLARPFPEEANRRLIDVTASALFAPTPRAEQVLLDEGIDPGRVLCSGNTVVDALEVVRSQQGPVARGDEVLVTIHRRESHGAPLDGLLDAIATLAGRFPDTTFILPVHPNPNVRQPVHERLGDVANVRLTEPMDHPTLVRHLLSARLVLTDSGGIQEEAPSLGVPVLVLREATERPEGIDAGVTRLVGVDPDRVIAEASAVLSDEAVRAAMTGQANPYGDGRAAQRIVAWLAGEDVEPWAGPDAGT